MVRANLPPGCRSLQFQDGSRYVAARDGGHVEVSEEHAKAVNRLADSGDAGLLSAKGGHYIGTKTGRWCWSCVPARLWNSWSYLCPRCGAQTEPDSPAP